MRAPLIHVVLGSVTTLDAPSENCPRAIAGIGMSPLSCTVTIALPFTIATFVIA